MKQGYDILCILVLIMCSLTVGAKDKEIILQCDTLEVKRSKIYYPVNKTKIYEDYMSNPRELEYIKRHLATSPRIDSIIIYSYASPEGGYDFNKKLATERGNTAKRYILNHIPEFRHVPDSLVRISPTAENWEGLREQVVSVYSRPDRERVLEIIDNREIDDVKRKHMLKCLDGGRTWRYILKNIMPHLRYATWVSVWRPVGEAIATPAMPKVKTENRMSVAPKNLPPIFYAEPVQTESLADTVTILALKSNLLYDAVSWVNYSIEVPFCGDKFSALYYHQFPWWRWGENNNKYCMRFLSIGGEVRWWFKPEPRPESEKYKKRDRLVGHFAGLYCESGKYDFERRCDICYQGEFWSVGLSYGYSFPVTRWLNLELSLSAGYASISHRGYSPSDDYSVLWRDPEKVGKWRYFGITKAQVSLVLPFRISMKKGGATYEE